ncbi:QueT transporter family protein [Anaerococcus degeneri]|uniref:QueT transporter family protein n=1 Tax=Anaerococcus degeneri TaxID=361500 RepID=A0ABS7YWM9_9FIRM|nr:QueT transporter family protein [Anaerococcus degeneri]MBP2015078.1 putative membrane protein [Anaerococcus degeneri]MCA2095338.1 QueT transporter family protein [Anaerococcus degeneri]
MKEKFISLDDTNFLVKSAGVAALYAVLTLLLPVASYGPIQFRFSEILVLLVFYNKRFIPGLVLGCAIANLFSPMMLFDVVFGTLSSYIAFILMQRAKNLYIASIFPVLLVSVPAIGTWLILASDEVFFVLLMQFMLSEFVMVSIIGVLLFKILEKNEGFMSYIYNF